MTIPGRLSVLTAMCFVLSVHGMTHGMLPMGTFGGDSVSSAATFTTGSSPQGTWVGNDFTGTPGYAELVTTALASETRSMVMSIPIPAAATYTLTTNVYRTNFATQTTYWHVLAVQNGVTLNLGNAGVPTTVSQTGVKSLRLVTLTDSSADLRWRTISTTYTVSASDVTTYSHLVFVFVGSKSGGDTLRFDEINTDAPYASTAVEGLDCVWVTRPSGISRLSDLVWTSPVRTSKEVQINWMSTNKQFYPGGPTQRFGMKLTGTLTVPRTGTWNFQLSSDDGSRLTVGTTVVVNHDGAHSYSARTGSISLTAGTYPIEVQFFENTGNRGLRLAWQGPGDAAYDAVPSSSFVPATSRPLRVVNWEEIDPMD